MASVYCRYHLSGHCKYGVHCRHRHMTETCENFPCNDDVCNKRHPKPCKYFVVNNFCKFHESCSYLHKNASNTNFEELDKEMKVLKGEIESLKNQIVELQQKMQVQGTSNQIPPSKTDLPLSLSTYSLTNIQSSRNLHFHQEIPQLDGVAPDPPAQLPPQEQCHGPEEDLCAMQCETCHETFQSIEEYTKHDQLQFCCDDCGLCYATQVQADLHVLQVHPDDNYAKLYIPESTKLLFSRNLQPTTK